MRGIRDAFVWMPRKPTPFSSIMFLTEAQRGTVTQVAAASLAEANEKVYTSLTYGIALEQDRGDGRKSHTVRFFDFDRPDGMLSSLARSWLIQNPRQVRVSMKPRHTWTRTC